MKTKIISIAGMLSLLALFIAFYISPVYSQGDPKCTDCSKATCDQSCMDKGTCDNGNCTEMKSQTSSAIPSGSGNVAANKTADCTNCNCTDCSNCTCDECMKQGACNGTCCGSMKSDMKMK